MTALLCQCEEEVEQAPGDGGPELVRPAQKRQAPLVYHRVRVLRWLHTSLLLLILLLLAATAVFFLQTPVANGCLHDNNRFLVHFISVISQSSPLKKFRIFSIFLIFMKFETFIVLRC